MQGLLCGTLLCFALALSRPAGAQASGAPLPDTARPDTAQLRQGLAAALGSDFEVVRTELHAGLHERGASSGWRTSVHSAAATIPSAMSTSTSTACGRKIRSTRT